MKIELVVLLLASAAWAVAGTDPVEAVDPFIGTAGTGHCFPGPCRPFGLVQPSPETGNANWKYCSGYSHDDAKILCFAQTHLNGTGQASLGDVAVMPVVADATKRNECASLGYYSVEFAGGVRVEIAAATRVARYRFTFPTGKMAQLRFDFTHGLYRDAHNRSALATTAAVERVSNRLLRGCHHSDVWASRDIAYVCRFNRDFASFGNDVATFADGGVIELEIALSTRSVEGAEKNLAAEGGVPFDELVAATHAEWQGIFKRVDYAASGDEGDRKSFWTAVYHLCIQPNVISDVGESARYSTFSLWDTFRSAHPFYEQLVPNLIPDFVNSLLDHHERYGYLPRWELWGRETNCMIGDHAVQVIVDAFQHRFKGVNWRRAYLAVKETLTTNRRKGNPGFYPPREERDLWDKYGYFPCDLVTHESVSRTLESAHDDYRAYEFAKGLGKKEDAEFFLRRSWNFTNLFDRATRCFRPRDSKGNFLEPFSPAAISRHYVEGSPLQYMWYVPHQTDWLIEAMGGKEQFESRLDAFFAGTLCPGEKRGSSPDVTGLIGDYCHGNEPCHYVVDLYRLVGRDDKADALVRRICRDFYRPTPDGVCGNEDCGQMSAWYLQQRVRLGDAYVTRRTLPWARSFRSAAVDRAVASTKAKIKCPKLAWMFENCFPNTLDTTVRYQLKDGEDDTFVITGDIEAMWLRDSAAQVWPYLEFAKEDPELAKMIRGVIRRQLDSILIDPYANAFNFGPTYSRHGDDQTEMKKGVFERKYELDSLCYPLRLADGYARATGDDSVYGARFRAALRVILDTMKEQQRKQDGLHTAYRFQRAAVVNNAVENHGYGRRVKPCGLIASTFRPSDDTTTLPFLIPSNFFAVDVLRKTAANLTRLGGAENAALARECAALAAEVRAAIEKYGIVEHPKYGKIYAFEVDGFGSAILMDDANVPSLLALPYFTDIPKDDPVYLNTRRFVLSEDNPYFFRGTRLTGVGGPHVGDGMVWPMSIVLQALTATDPSERDACLKMLVETDGGTGFIHESAWKDDPKNFTRSWFAWANTLFGELVYETCRNK